MTEKPLMFLAVYFVAIGIAKLGYVLVMKAKDSKNSKTK